MPKLKVPSPQSNAALLSLKYAERTEYPWERKEDSHWQGSKIYIVCNSSKRITA